jgi:DNA-binding transcriptional MerR regulator
MKSYTKKQISEITGLPPRMVQFYTDEGLVTPEVDKGKGRGRVRRYGQRNLFSFALIKELNDYGIRIDKIRHIFEVLIESREFQSDKDIKKFERFLSGEAGETIERRMYLWIRKSGNPKDNEIISAPIFLPHWKSVNKDGGGEDIIRGIDEDLIKNCISLMVIDLWGLYQKVCLRQKNGEV